MTRIICISIIIGQLYCCQKGAVESNFSEIIIGEWSLSEQTGWPDKEPLIYETILHQFIFKSDGTFESINPGDHSLDYEGNYSVKDEEVVILTMSWADFEGVDFRIPEFDNSFFIIERPTDEGVVSQTYRREL
jgi:hypothetical protein